MRPIKFRGKTSTLSANEVHEQIDGRWFYGSFIKGNKDHCYIKESLKAEGFWVRPETVGQFTGLLDKNGKEIYEGDLMPVYENGEEYIYKVVYDGDCFMLGFIDGEQGSYPLSVKRNISEVIGNIHDNRELLSKLD